VCFFANQTGRKRTGKAPVLHKLPVYPRLTACQSGAGFGALGRQVGVRCWVESRKTLTKNLGTAEDLVFTGEIAQKSDSKGLFIASIQGNGEEIEIRRLCPEIHLKTFEIGPVKCRQYSYTVGLLIMKKIERE
jgi:hypothetical protein